MSDKTNKNEKQIEKIKYDRRTIISNSVTGLIWRGVGYLLSFLTTPLLLSMLGEEKYGIWATLLSSVGIIYTFDFGIGRGVQNRVAEALATERTEDARRYIATSYILLGIISAGLFFLFSTIVHFADIGAFLGITYKDESIRTILYIALFFACLNFATSIVTNILRAQQKAGQVTFYNTLGQGLYVLAIFIATKFNITLIGVVALIQGITQFIKNMIATGIVFKKTPALRFKLSDYGKKYSQGIISLGIQVFVMNIAALVLNSTDNIIISRYLGAVNVTPYNICLHYFSIIEAVFLVILSPIASAYTAAYARKDLSWIEKAFKRSLLGWLVFACGIVLAGFVFKPFARLWLGKELDYGNSLIFTVGAYYMLLLFNHVFSAFLMAISMIKESMIVNIIMTIINIPLSILFAVHFKMGLTGVILGSVVCIAIGAVAGPIKSYFVFKRIRAENWQRQQVG